ncbi:MAG: hypothetical protein EOO61_18835 [Hymenobacter sp.]|nr:MAG: hypothetical protein EOO61_18835 [Hymenobacter sp.]
MKNSLLAVASLLGFLFTSCSTDHRTQAIQPDLQLVSPNGVKIAKSVEELDQLAHQLMADKHGVGTTITITKVDYKELRTSPENSFAATIYYNTAKGQQDHFELYGGRPELTN